MIFRFQLTLSPGTDLLIGDTSNIMHFLQKNCMHFTLDNVLQFCLSSLWSLLFYVLGSLMVFSGSWKCRDCKLVGISSSISRISRHIFQLQRCPKRNGTGIELWIQPWRFLLYIDNHFSFRMRISMNHRNSILVHFVDWLFHTNSLFQEEIALCALVCMCYVMGTCDCVRSIILLPLMMGRHLCMSCY